MRERGGEMEREEERNGGKREKVAKMKKKGETGRKETQTDKDTEKGEKVIEMKLQKGDEGGDAKITSTREERAD